MSSDLALYPLKLYIFDQEGGKYDPADVIEIPNEESLFGVGIRTAIDLNIKLGFEIRITDPWDNLVFHALGGRVVFPTEAMRENPEAGW